MGVNYYRLKQINYNGEFKYSEIIEVEIEPSFEQLGLDVTLYEGCDGLGLMMMAEDQVTYELSIHNVQGQELRKIVDQIDASEVKNYTKIDEGLPNGVYIVLVRSHNLVWSSKFKK